VIVTFSVVDLVSDSLVEKSSFCWYVLYSLLPILVKTKESLN